MNEINIIIFRYKFYIDSLLKLYFQKKANIFLKILFISFYILNSRINFILNKINGWDIKQDKEIIIPFSKDFQSKDKPQRKPLFDIIFSKLKELFLCNPDQKLSILPNFLKNLLKTAIRSLIKNKF